MELSRLEFRSLGIVVEDKKADSYEIQVVPIEMTGFIDGEVDSHTDQETVGGEDASGQTYQVNLQTSNSISAKWLPYGSNRYTAPDVVKNEMVKVYQYADTDQFYWASLGNHDHLRPHETVVHLFSNKGESNEEPLSIDNCYSLEVSTKNKNVTLRTTKTNGEPYGYMLQVNSGGGTLFFTDDNGTYINLNSGENTIELKNADGTLFQIVKKDINVTAAEGTITFIAKDIVEKSTKGHTITTMQFNAQATTNYSVSTATYGVAAATMSYQGSGLTFTAPATFAQATTFNGTITHNGKVIDSTHTHDGVKSGGDVSGTVT